MFTGIVEELGEVVALERLNGSARLTIKGSVVAGAAHGDSIAVNGVCLTVTAVQDTAFTADVMGETLKRSDIGVLAPGSPVNLERPLRLADRLGGHLVQGHVDGTGRIVSRRPAGQWEVLRISLPNGLARYVTEKGSVAVDGVSLTVSALGALPARGDDPPDPPPNPWPARGDDPPEPWFEVSLIPTTLELTTLGTKQPGDLVNLEVDVVAKYVEKLLDGRRS
ncbi:MAG: riboflavin synthase [Micromonosporaceae bacterium]